MDQSQAPLLTREEFVEDRTKAAVDALLKNLEVGPSTGTARRILELLRELKAPGESALLARVVALEERLERNENLLARLAAGSALKKPSRPQLPAVPTLRDLFQNGRKETPRVADTGHEAGTARS